jgi:hypothetical protein
MGGISECNAHFIVCNLIKSLSLYQKLKAVWVGSMSLQALSLRIHSFNIYLLYRMILDYCFGVSVTYTFQTENNKIKLLTEYENVTQEVLLPIELMLQISKQFQHARISWHIKFENYTPRKPGK